MKQTFKSVFYFSFFFDKVSLITFHDSLQNIRWFLLKLNSILIAKLHHSSHWTIKISFCYASNVKISFRPSKMKRNHIKAISDEKKYQMNSNFGFGMEFILWGHLRTVKKNNTEISESNQNFVSPKTFAT